jgi:hypothetical protein
MGEMVIILDVILIAVVWEAVVDVSRYIARRTQRRVS